MFWPRLDVNQSSQVKTHSMFDCSAFGADLHNRDRVKLFDLLLSLSFKLPGIQRILPSLVDDHVKHDSELFKLRRDHVTLSLKLPCSDAIKL